MYDLPIKLKVEPRALPLAERFTIATKSWDIADNVFVRLTYDGHEGIGEVSPEDRSGDSVGAVTAQLERVDLGGLRGPFDLEGVTELLPAGPARCALDIAAHDLAAKLAGVSVAELLGVGRRQPPPTSVTLPITEVDRMVERARGFEEYPVIKMKVGFDGDVDALARVREVFSGRIRIDANEGWEPDRAAASLREMERFDIELCEQPIKRGQVDALREVTAATSIPIYADEDVETSGDAAALQGVVDGVNLKLRKTGGIREAVRAIATARSLGMGVMIGCDLESGVAATAEACVATLADHCDIDGPLLLAEDPWPGVVYDRGRVTLPPGPGLGVRGRER
ncbi:MAG: dipeptide epimerase [Actinomycetota bacterium]|nr:dipeptide epimerase [Actinomycetota bacterium]